MFGEVGNIIGQALSIVAVIVGFITFQMRSSKGILALQILSALIFAALALGMTVFPERRKGSENEEI